jgi:hypothetical protein
MNMGLPFNSMRSCKNSFLEEGERNASFDRDAREVLLRYITDEYCGESEYRAEICV